MATDDSGYGELLVLQHHELTGPDLLVPTLEARAGQRPWRTFHAGVDPLPTLTEQVRGVLVLGGPMGVHDRAEHAWIDDELGLLAEAVDRDVPVLGICLGAQLLATATGGEVSRRDVPEVGVFPLERTAAGQEDAIFAGWPDGGHVLLSHRDEVSRLPAGGVAMLAGSDGVPAWRLGDDRHYGVQFHPEASPDTVAAWLAHDELREMYVAGGADPDGFLADLRRRAAFLRAVGVSLIGRWLDGVVGADDPGPQRKPRR